MLENTPQNIISFHQIFEAQVEKNPEAIAVVCNDQQLTYSELNQKANQLANYLQDLGAVPDQLVGLFMERSLDIVVAILGIFKAGAAYVPLDPSYPSERLTYIAQETQFSLLLTQKHLRDRLPLSSAKISYIDSNWDTIAQYSSQNLATKISPGNLAYIMYTSGSTGQPKGVKMPYINIVRYIQALSQVVTVQPEDIYLHVASFSFSSSIRQLMLPLSQGAKVVIATREQTKNPLALLNLMIQQQVTVSDGVCSIWRSILEILEDLEQQQFYLANLRLKSVVLSGENTTCALLQKIRNFLGKDIRFFNVYGQTETIGNFCYEMPQDFARHEGYFPVGYPYGHNHYYILDETLNPVPPGEAGELMMAGGCLARGYLNRDDLTAAKFIPNPWAQRDSTSDRPLPKLFKTGDVVRQLPDGSVELLGRTDFQVKIRGMRVELDEIATILEEHDKVKQATVVAHQKPSGENILVAYIIPEPEANDPDDPDHSILYHKLREFLKQKLPDYMLPAVFMEITAFPRTPNGKLDRLALPKPSFLDNQPGDGEYAADTEIKKLFCETLNLRQVQPEDTFISLGGNSLSYIQVSMKLERYLGYLPAGWEAMMISELEQEKPQQHHNNTLETSIFFRALAICEVVVQHAQLPPAKYIYGGAFLMLLIAGINFARFQGKFMLEGRVVQPVISLLKSLLIPYMLLVGAYQAYQQKFNWSVLLCCSNLFDPGMGSIFFVWFIQVLVQVICIFLLLFSLPKIRALAKLSPWKFGCGLVVIGVLVNRLIPVFWIPYQLDHKNLFNQQLPHKIFWLFALGWCINFAKSREEKIVTSILLSISLLICINPTEAYWPGEAKSLMLWLLIGGMTVIWQEYLLVPFLIKQPIQLLASASYYIYLTHIVFISIFEKVMGINSTLLYVILAILSGIFVWEGMDLLEKWAYKIFRKLTAQNA